MTVSSTTNRKEYAGNDVTTSFSTSPVVFFASADLTVYVVSSAGVVTTLTENTHYTVSGGGTPPATGSVSLAGGSSPYGAPATGATLVIVRDVDIVQETDFVQNDGSDADVAEAALDKLTIISQQLDARMDRTLRLSDSDATGLDLTLPDASATTRASTIIGLDALGTGLELYDPSSAVTAASNITVTQAGTGAVAETAQTNFRRLFYPEQYGAVGNDSTNDSTAVANAAAAAIAGKGILYLQNDYYIPSGFTITGPLRIAGPGQLRGTAVALGGLPSTVISATGTLGSSVSLGTGAIAYGTSSFTATNTFSPGDVVLISNASGASTSRREILVINTAAAGSFTTQTGTVNTYAGTTSAIARKITFKERIFLDGVRLKNIQFKLSYARNFTAHKVTAIGCDFPMYYCFQFAMDFTQWDQGNTIGQAAILSSSRDFSVSGNFNGGDGVSDNGVIKIMQSQKFRINAVINGTVNGGGYLHGVMVDTYWASNPDGYDYGVSSEGDINVVVTDVYGSAVDLANVASGTADLVCRDFRLSGVFGRPGSGYGSVNIKNYSHVVIDADFGGSTGPGFQLGAAVGDTQSDINFRGFNGDPTAVTFNGTNTNIRGLDVRALAYVSATITNVTGDATAYTVIFGSETTDTFNAYNTGTGLFTCPVTGEYEIITTLDFQGIAAGHTDGNITVLVNGTAKAINPINLAAIQNAFNEVGVPATWRLSLTKGDTVGIQVKAIGGAKTVDIGGDASTKYSWASFRLVAS